MKYVGASFKRSISTLQISHRALYVSERAKRGFINCLSMRACELGYCVRNATVVITN